jgi:hypothetical protein
MFILESSSKIKEARYSPSLAGIGLKDSVRKWREAHYLIRRGYVLYFMDTLCGLCKVNDYCNTCQLHKKGFCEDIEDFYASNKGSIEVIRTKLKRLQELLREENNQ